MAGNVNRDNQISKLILEDVLTFIYNNHWMPAPQIHFILFFFPFDTQINTHTGIYADYAICVIIEAFNKWAMVHCSKNIIRCKIIILSTFCCSIKNISSGKHWSFHYFFYSHTHFSFLFWKIILFDFIWHRDSSFEIDNHSKR